MCPPEDFPVHKDENYRNMVYPRRSKGFQPPKSVPKRKAERALSGKGKTEFPSFQPSSAPSDQPSSLVRFLSSSHQIVFLLLI